MLVITDAGCETHRKLHDVGMQQNAASLTTTIEHYDRLELYMRTDVERKGGHPISVSLSRKCG